MKSPDDLAARRARVTRIQAKAPRELVIEPTYRPNPARRAQLLDVLEELLDEATES